MKPASLRWIAALCALLLQSCGGGGGGGAGGNPPPPPPPSNSLIGLTAGHGENVGILIFGLTEQADQGMELLTLAAQILEAGLLTRQTFSCAVNGTVELTAIDANSDGSLDAGDTVTVTYVNCGSSVSGTLRLAVTAVAFAAGEISSLDGTMTVDLEFASSPTIVLDVTGTLAYRASADSLSWLGTGLAVTIAGGNQSEGLISGRVAKTLAARTFDYTVTLSGTVDSDLLQGRFSFDTAPPLTGEFGWWPQAGRVTARGGNNSTITYRTGNWVQGGAVYEVDADGNGVVDGGSIGVDWQDIAIGILFGVDGEDAIQPPNPPPSLLGRRIVLDSRGEDLQVDAARGRIYVTLPDRNELVVFSAQTLEVIQRVHISSRPTGLSLSADGEELFVGLGASGAIGIVDPDSFAISTIFIATELGSSQVHNVVETSPGVLYAGTGIANADGRIVRVDRASGTVTPVASMPPSRDEIELLADPARAVLYAGDGRTGINGHVHKFDVASAQTPQLLVTTPGSLHTHRLSLDPAGERLYVSDGQVLRTSDFSLVGQVTQGTPWASDNGVDLLVANGQGTWGATLTMYSTADLHVVDTLDSDCMLGQEFGDPIRRVHRLAPSPVDGQWLLLGGNILCGVDLNNPGVPPGTGQPPPPPPPLPTVNVQSFPVMSPSGTIFDYEYDAFRNRVYATVQTAGELVTMDAATHQVIAREVLGNRPRGLALSPDGSTLAIMFFDNGNIGFKDVASGQIEMRDLTSLLGTTAGNDVAWINNDIVFASADPPCCEAGSHVVRVSRSDPLAARRSAGGVAIFGRQDLTASPDGQFLYLMQSFNALHKLDLGAPDEPMVQSYQAPDVGVPFATPLGHVAPSPDGQRLAFSNGNIVRVSDFIQVGQSAAGAALYSPDGGSLYHANGPDFIDRYDPATLAPTLRYVGGCTQTPSRLQSNATGNVVMGQAQLHVCFTHLDLPVAGLQQLAIHSAYACDTGCLRRQYFRKSALGRWGWARPELH